jgi:methylmalonyl-CoA mutase N-terminal domain/subunit
MSDRRYKTIQDLPEWTKTTGGQQPGEFPFVRGIHPKLYTERLWRMRQYAGFGTPGDTNAKWKGLLEHGQDGVSCAFDLPTQLGYDSDDSAARSEAGRLGVAIDSLADFVALFDGIPLDSTGATFNVNASAAVIYAMLLEAADQQGVEPARLTGSLSNDPLMEFIARGLWRLPPAGSMRLMADVFAHAIEHAPGFYPINLRGTLVYEAGGTSLQELGFALACAQEYLDAVAARGVDMDAATAHFSFLFFSDSNFLEEAAKFRAARMLWAEMVKERYGVLSPSGQKLRFTAAVGNFNLRAQIPELNLVRNTLGALGAVLGGCQGMLVAGMDEAFEIPSEYASLLGLYTQQVIAHESRVTGTVDPLGGSYHVESTTDQIMDGVRRIMSDLDRSGGAIRAIEDGELQGAISESAYAYQLDEETGRRVVVGVNTPGSQPPSDPEFALHEHDDAALSVQRSQLLAHRRDRDGSAVTTTLAALDDVLSGDTNSIDAIRAAVRAGATMGEVMTVCVGRYGEFREPTGSV